MKSTLIATLAALAALFAPSSMAQAAPNDARGCADHPIVSRYAGSEIFACRPTSYQAYKLPKSRIDAIGPIDKTDKTHTTLEGDYTGVAYRGPKGRTGLEVFRNYQQALTAAGAQVLFQCETDACGGQGFTRTQTRDFGQGVGNTLFASYADQRYIAAKIARPGKGDAYVGILVGFNNRDITLVEGQRALVLVEVLEAAAMETGKVVVDANAMKTRLAAEGKVALYGVYFDTGKSAVKPESQPQIDEIVKLLAADPKLAVYVVGHTDDQGQLGPNQTLSQQRAAAMVEKLVKDHKIAAGRLTPLGVGPAAPVASNTTDAGRALNRRTEIVARLAQ